MNLLKNIINIKQNCENASQLPLFIFQNNNLSPIYFSE